MRKGIILLAGVLAVLATFLVSSALSAQEEVNAEEKVYAGLRKRIAVTAFESKVPAAYGVGSGMAEMLITALHKTGRFIVLERRAIEDIIAEQDLAADGRIRPETAAEIGGILGAQILIRGAITQYNEKDAGRGLGIGIGGFGIGMAGTTGHVVIDMRMFCATTGVILESHAADQKVTTRGLALGGRVEGVTFGAAGFERTGLGKATRAAIDDAVQFIVGRMEVMPWQGRVVKAREGRIFINAGSRDNIRVGMTFDIYSEGEELIDPGTGISLGFIEEKRGKLEIITVQDKFSIGRPLSGSGFTRRDIVRWR